MLSRFVSIQSVRSLASTTSSKILPALPTTPEEKTAHVRRLIQAKEKTGLSFTEIAKRCGITNAYCAQLFYGRACADQETASKLKKIVPTLTDEDIQMMSKVPLRTFDPTQFQDPTLYRLYEAISQYGEGIKALINEEFGDGIMSAIGVYVKVDKVIGPEGEPRIVITFNGKFLPHIVQKTEILEKMKKG